MSYTTYCQERNTPLYSCLMHALLLVTINRSHAHTSRTARKYVFTMLYRMPKLVHAYDREHSPVADWLVIGGRFNSVSAC